MPNRYFHASEDNIDFIYANIAVKNIYFALVSLDYIFDHNDFEIGIYHNLLDRDTDPYMRAVIQTNNHLRTFDKEAGIYYTFIRKGHSLERFEYNLHDLRCELKQMLERITSNPVFDSAWTDSISTETVA